jgi:hypothetical protein
MSPLVALDWLTVAVWSARSVCGGNLVATP